MPRPSTISASLSVGDVLYLLRRRWVPALAVVIACISAAALAAVLMTPTYRAEVVVVPRTDDASGTALAGFASQFGGLASLAGMSMRSSSDTVVSIATLNSRGLLAAFIEDRNLLPVLFAKQWDSEAGKWSVNDASEIPTLNDGIDLIDREIREVFEDKDTGLVTLSIEWHDRQQAADWANGLVELSNARLRLQAITDARLSIDYLQRELQATEMVSVREVINRLLDSSIQQISLANVNPEFAFRVVDRARPPDADDYVRPSWPLMLLTGGAVGLALAFLIVAWGRPPSESEAR